MQNRVLTASERIYREWLDANAEEDRDKLEGELVAICIAACRRRGITPPYEWRSHPKHEYGKGRWVGGRRSLPSWVRDWVHGELSSAEPLKDGARYIGRRCVNALIDKIRWHERRKRGAQIRVHGRGEVDPEEVEREREYIALAMTDLGLPDCLPLEGDRNLLKRLLAAYPARPSNVSIAREMGLSEGAVRKRRRRISEICFGIADGQYRFCTELKRLGLKPGTKKQRLGE